MTKVKYFGGIVGAFLLTLCLMVPSGLAAGDFIKIGIPLALTGPKAKFGEMHHKSYLIALDEINAAGGMRKGPYKGYKLKFLFEDSIGKPEVGRSLAEKLIAQDKVPIIMGGYSSSVVYGIAAVCERNGIPFISPSGAADKITQQGWKYVFRLNPTASEYSSGLQDFLLKVVKPKSMSILYENTLFGTSNSKAMKKWCEGNGIKVAAYEGFEAGAVDFKPMLTKIKAKNADVIYMAAYLMDGMLLVKQSSELNIQPKLLAGGAAAFTMPEFIEGVGDLSENIISATLWVPGVSYPGAMDYFKKYKKRYGSEPDYHGAEGYSAAYVCRDVLERTKSLKPEDILASLAATNMMTPFGPIKFISYKKYTNQNRLPTLVIQIQNGKHETIWPENAATAKYIYPVKEWYKK